MARRAEDLAAGDPGAVDAKGKARLDLGHKDADQLLAELNRPQMPRMLLYAFLIHVLLVAVTSMGYISLCVKHHSLHPRQIIQALEREAAEKKVKEDAAKLAADLAKRAAAAPAQPAAAPAPARDGSSPAKEGAAPAEKKKSKIEQEVEKTSTERPNKPSVSLDSALDLD